VSELLTANLTFGVSLNALDIGVSFICLLKDQPFVIIMKAFYATKRFK